MSGQEFVDRLKAQFGEGIRGANLEAIDPWIEIAPESLVEVCTYLRDEPDLRFNLLCCVSGVDYFEPDPKKAAKTGWTPHLEVVYHLWSIPHKCSLVLKVSLPRWKDG
ncbi:MAG: NADH-quinone oxidoreductase subunit C, partial [Planctomycetia bacterium]|nr:NADH-quinone oxidoreductase subunit C [Planctomycetia bacterium]